MFEFLCNFKLFCFSGNITSVFTYKWIGEEMARLVDSGRELNASISEGRIAKPMPNINRYVFVFLLHQIVRVRQSIITRSAKRIAVTNFEHLILLLIRSHACTDTHKIAVSLTHASNLVCECVFGEIIHMIAVISE